MSKFCQIWSHWLTKPLPKFARIVDLDQFLCCCVSTFEKYGCALAYKMAISLFNHASISMPTSVCVTHLYISVCLNACIVLCIYMCPSIYLCAPVSISKCLYLNPYLYFLFVSFSVAMRASSFSKFSALPKYFLSSFLPLVSVSSTEAWQQMRER